MSGSSAYPGAVDVDQSNVDNVDLVLAADVNDAQKSANQAQIYLGQDPLNITDALAGSPLTAPNVVGGYTGATGGSNAARRNPQVGALSTIATMLKRITGNASWLTSPLASIAQILGFKIVTSEAVATLTGSVNISVINGVGALGSMPAAAASNNGWLYLVTSGGTASQPNNTLYRSNGSAWVIASASTYTAGSFAAGDLAYYDATNQRWTRLAIGSSGQFLRVTAGIPAWVTGTAAMLGAVAEPAGLAAGDTVYWDGAAWQKAAIGSASRILGSDGTKPVWTTIPSSVEITLPARWDGSVRAWSQYSTIQAAIDASVDRGDANVAWDYVVIPPGYYTESINLKPDVPVVELVPNTVTIRGTVTMDEYCYIMVYRLQPPTALGGTYQALVLNAAHANTYAIAIIHEIDISEDNSGAACVREGIKVTKGILQATVRQWRYSANFNCTARFVTMPNALGTLNLDNPSIARMPGSSTWAAIEFFSVSGGVANIYGGSIPDDPTNFTALKRTSGTLNVYGVQYNRRRVSGVVNQSIGDRASSHFASAAFFNSAI